MMRALPCSAADDPPAPGNGMTAASAAEAARAHDLWRTVLGAGIERYREWLHRNGLADAQASLRLARLAAQVSEEQPAAALAAEKSNGASALGDTRLLERSGRAPPERSAAAELATGRRSALAGIARAELDDLVAGLRARLEGERRAILEQLRELEYLRGKNSGLVATMTQKVRADREEFERGLARFQALRGVFAAHSDRLYTHLGLDALAEEWRRTRADILGAAFTPGVRSAMSRYFREVRGKLERAALEVAEIAELMAVMYRKFSDEHGLQLSTPVAFSTLRYVKEVERIEAGYASQFDTPMTMLTNDKQALAQKFFDAHASQVKRCYEYANREVDDWLRAIMAPMETQVHERQLQLRRRLESIKRIRQATDTLAERIGELAPIERTLREQLDALARLRSEIDNALAFGGREPVQPA
ncbi:MAG: hypothetical protein HYY28_05990 [Betaproteobacteria bacterium]|nr:hypothetical protein [Betaproteobacteria bacterium]